jgi:hypothetical protein
LLNIPLRSILVKLPSRRCTEENVGCAGSWYVNVKIL